MLYDNGPFATPGMTIVKQKLLSCLMKEGLEGGGAPSAVSGPSGSLALSLPVHEDETGVL